MLQPPHCSSGGGVRQRNHDAAQRQRFVQLKEGSVYLQENGINHIEKANKAKACRGLL